MRSSRKTKVLVKNSTRPHSDSDVSTELTNAWRSLAQSKAALRHIENHLEATPGTSVLLESISDPVKKKFPPVNRDGGQIDEHGPSSKPKGIRKNSPTKRSSRSPLRNATQDCNVRKINAVEFKEPLVAYREPTPPPHTFTQLEARNPQSSPGTLRPSAVFHSESVHNQLFRQRDTTNKQTEMDSSLSSAQESIEVRYLNDQTALNVYKSDEQALRAAELLRSKTSSPCLASHPGSPSQGESSTSSSPGSASQRLENLRRHQADGKLEKLKERIRRQRQHLEETAQREKLRGHLEQPIVASEQNNDACTNNIPTAKIRKVAVAPPAPIYKGFNNVETKIKTPDGKVWREEEFHNLSREMYKDLSRQFAESTCPKQQQQREQRLEKSKEKRPAKPIRKVQKLTAVTDSSSKPVISPASWREGQKLVKMVLGPIPKTLKEEAPTSPTDRRSRTARHHPTDPLLEASRNSRPNSSEGQQNGSLSKPIGAQITELDAEPEASGGVNADLLSADIQGILDDLQLVCKPTENEEKPSKSSGGVADSRRGRGGSASRTRTPVSTWGSSARASSCPRATTHRSSSPSSRQPELTDKGAKKRHYDAETVRQYIARQQEERKKRQAEQKKAAKQEVERKNQRLQELYRKQREAAKTVALSSDFAVAPVHRRLQETYTKLMLEEAELEQNVTQEQLDVLSLQRIQMYQPSGESDKENKRLEAPQSPSSSDKSSIDQAPPPLSRDDLDVGIATFLQPDHSRASSARPPSRNSIKSQSSKNEHLLAQLLRLEEEVAAGNTKHTLLPDAMSSSKVQSRLSRIEAIKATAASLSNRIESEARKLAGHGRTYGANTSSNVEAALTTGAPKDDGDRWKEITAYVTESRASLKTPRTASATGHSSYNDATLYETGKHHNRRAKRQTPLSGMTSPQRISPDSVGAAFDSHQPSKKLVGGFEMRERTSKVASPITYASEEPYMFETDLHNSSAGSISEGPIVSEGSLSEDEVSPPQQPGKYGLKPDYSNAKIRSWGEQEDNQPLLEFQREAAMSCPLSPSFHFKTPGAKAPLEELSKGSPLSVINIYTKNMQVNEKMVPPPSPPANVLLSENGPGDSVVYEEDFVSSHSSKASDQSKRASNLSSKKSHLDGLIRRSPLEKSLEGSPSRYSSPHSSRHSPLPSSASTSGSSPLSRHSAKKRRILSEQSDSTLVGECRKSCSPRSGTLSPETGKEGADRNSPNTPTQNFQPPNTFGEIQSQPAERSRSSPHPGSPESLSHPRTNIVEEPAKSSPTTAHKAKAEASLYNGELQYSPAVLQQRMTAELEYLESIQDSMKHLGDVERLMGVSMAQQESASLAQMLKAKQNRHECDLYELKIKAEREALEMKLQFEENRQQVARAHIELQESLATSQKGTLEGLQEATTKMMSQQAEAARNTAEAARHIKEMTELARSQVVGTLMGPPAPAESALSDLMYIQRNKNQQEDRDDSDSFPSGVVSRRNRPEVPSPSQSESVSYPRPINSELNSSISHHVSPQHRQQRLFEEAERKKPVEAVNSSARHTVSSSIEEDLPGAVNDSACSDSVPSVMDEKGENTSVATDYSLKFDESMTEDEIEEQSFRSVLPSEAHRRGTIEKKPRPHEESEDDGTIHNATPVPGTDSQCTLKSQDIHIIFSGGQNSFSQFTMDMVRQYMKDEEVRLQHQSSLLHLRQKALKEKTKTELAWLELQKKRLRDKGEDDKMPPIRKRQRGLLIKLQQEQAEIKRLQEANRAARKERQLLLKQQEEIERMRNSTLRLKERLKCAEGEGLPDTPVSEQPPSEVASSNLSLAEDVRSSSPSHSISGSETSSIMQKLKKMRSHMDEKFLTKREQQLMQRRHHAEELLQWKKRLDQEEAEVRRMEKKALVVWEQKRLLEKDARGSEVEGNEITEIASHPSCSQGSVPKTDIAKEIASEENSPEIPEYIVHTEEHLAKEPGSPSSSQASSISERLPASVHASVANYTPDFLSATQTPTKKSFSCRGSHSPAASPSDTQLLSSIQALSEVSPLPPVGTMATPSETISDQSDIETRVKALKEELRKRKLMAYQLKKEQRKRHKERLKAQEATLLKQLETYDDFIEKTRAELRKEPEATPANNLQNKDSKSHSEILSPHPSLQRSDSTQSSASEGLNEQLDSNASSELRRFKSIPPKDVSVEKRAATPPISQSDRPMTPEQKRQPSPAGDYNDEKVTPEIQEELEGDFSPKSMREPSQHLLKLSQEDDRDSPSDHIPFSGDGRHGRSQAKLSQEHKEVEPSNLHRVEVTVSGITFAGQHQPADVSPKSNADPISIPSNKDEVTHDEAPSIGEGYNDDFESTDSRSDEHYSKSNSPLDIDSSNKDSSVSVASHGSQDKSIEEEIAVELSQVLSVSEDSRKSGRLLDLNELSQENKSIRSSHSPVSSPLQTPASVKDEMPSFNIGDRVLVGGVQSGTLRFKGHTSFANGFWAGVELDKPEGSNNGTYDGVVYFACRDCHGIFAPTDKIAHLPDNYKPDADTAEDVDSFFDDLSKKSGSKQTIIDDTSKRRESPPRENSPSHNENSLAENRNVSGANQASPNSNSPLASLHQNEPSHPLSNGNEMDVILDSADPLVSLLLTDVDKVGRANQVSKATATLFDNQNANSHHLILDNKVQQKSEHVLDTIADTLVKNLLNETVGQFTQMKKMKEQKIKSANQMLGYPPTGSEEEDKWISSVDQKDGLHFFLPVEQEVLSSPELCNQSVSPVLGASGQEELAKRLAELELSRELVEDHADDQDWFDEDFGLSSHRKQRLRQKDEVAHLEGEPSKSSSSAGRPMGVGTSSLGAESQAKTPLRPELPLPLPPRLPEQPAMVVPHSATEVEKMAHAATQEIWEMCNLGRERALRLPQMPSPTPSLEYLRGESNKQESEILSIQSYRKAVFDLTWEIIQEIYLEEPESEQPQWIKPRQFKSSSIHQVKISGDLNKIQEFVAAEVLKLYGLNRNQSQRNDWQKMLKFGRKKRDRVDQILVQELQEEEAQWVNYDEDELSVKMQLADSIFDALLKDTADTFTHIFQKVNKKDAI